MPEEVETDGNRSTIGVILNVWSGDGPELLRKSISSVLRQSRQPDQFIIVVDGPIPPRLEGVLESSELVRPEVRIVYLETQVGLPMARNRGLEVLETTLVAFHDADDLMHPRRIEVQVERIEMTDADLVAASCWEFDIESMRVMKLRSSAVGAMLRPEDFFWNNPICHSSVLARTDVIRSHGGYRNVHLMEDYDLWLRMLLEGRHLEIHSECLQALGINSRFATRRGGIRFFKSELVVDRVLREFARFGAVRRAVRLVGRCLFRVSPVVIRGSILMRRSTSVVSGGLTIDEIFRVTA